MTISICLFIAIMLNHSGQGLHYISLNTIFNVNCKYVVLGYNDSSNAVRDDRKSRVINMVVSIAKYATFRVWCKHKSNKNTYLVQKEIFITHSKVMLSSILKSKKQIFQVFWYTSVLERVCLNLKCFSSNTSSLHNLFRLLISVVSW